jgi:hypothetical protein
VVASRAAAIRAAVRAARCLAACVVCSTATTTAAAKPAAVARRAAVANRAVAAAASADAVFPQRKTWPIQRLLPDGAGVVFCCARGIRIPAGNNPAQRVRYRVGETAGGTACAGSLVDSHSR